MFPHIILYDYFLLLSDLQVQESLEKERDGLAAQLSISNGAALQGTAAHSERETRIGELEEKIVEQNRQLATQSSELDELNEVIKGLEKEKTESEDELKKSQTELEKRKSQVR